MAIALERLNVNIPPEARARLQALAKRAQRTEGELARTLILRAIGRAERAELRKQLRAFYTPERRARDVQITEAVEELRGEAR